MARERYSCCKFYTIGQHEKEEAWLNRMSIKGMHLVSIKALWYTFERGEPGEYIYRMEFLEHGINHPEIIPYIEFMEDTGVEVIGSFKRWVYYRKKASEGPFEVYSDTESKIRHYERIIKFANFCMFINLCLIVMYTAVGLQLVPDAGEGAELLRLLLTNQNMPIIALNIFYLPFFFLITLHVRMARKRLVKEKQLKE